MLTRQLFKTIKSSTPISRAFASHFAHVPEAPPDKILGLNELYIADTDPNKINLGVGAYRDDNGKPWVLPCVKEAEKKIYGMDHEYGIISGSKEFTTLSTKFAYGDNSVPIKENRICAVQSLSGTGSLALLAQFLGRYSHNKDIYVPNPTWGNHFNIFRSAGLTVGTYRYLDTQKFSLDVEQTVDDINQAKDSSIFMFHACAHNPTGFDPTQEEWKAISNAMKSKNHIMLFDCAYQGFASGDANKDAWAIRHFVDEGHNVLLAQSFAKNFGLYGERIGCASIVTQSSDEAKKIMSQMKVIVRSLWSNPPLYGCRLVTEILKDTHLKSQWYKECKVMADRIISMRLLLVDNLKLIGSTKNWDFIKKQIGMFAFTGLSKDQVNMMVNKHHIYMTEDGRISMAGVNTGNVKKIAECFHDVTK